MGQRLTMSAPGDVVSDPVASGADTVKSMQNMDQDSIERSAYPEYRRAYPPTPGREPKLRLPSHLTVKQMAGAGDVTCELPHSGEGEPDDTPKLDNVLVGQLYKNMLEWSKENEQNPQMTLKEQMQLSGGNIDTFLKEKKSSDMTPAQRKMERHLDQRHKQIGKDMTKLEELYKEKQRIGDTEMLDGVGKCPMGFGLETINDQTQILKELMLENQTFEDNSARATEMMGGGGKCPMGFDMETSDQEKILKELMPGKQTSEMKPDSGPTAHQLRSGEGRGVCPMGMGMFSCRTINKSGEPTENIHAVKERMRLAEADQRIKLSKQTPGLKFCQMTIKRNLLLTPTSSDASLAGSSSNLNSSKEESAE